MSAEIQDTQHAFLVAWGWLAQQIGLIERLRSVRLKQKHYQHTPQSKVLEFLVAILAGLQHLQDISRSAHPLDQGLAVAQAWGQEGLADCSGVSRTLSWEEVRRKESKQVFSLHRIKVHSEPAIFLQECFVLFAANFIRWASRWLASRAIPEENSMNVDKMGIKTQVQVAAHVSAQVICNSDSRLLRFNQQSLFAGKAFRLPADHQPLQKESEFWFSMPFFVKWHLITQPLR